MQEVLRDKNKKTKEMICKDTVELFVDQDFLAMDPETRPSNGEDIITELHINQLSPRVKEMMDMYDKYADIANKYIDKLEAVDYEIDQLHSKVDKKMTIETLKPILLSLAEKQTLKIGLEKKHQYYDSLMKKLYVCYKAYKRPKQQEYTYQKILFHNHITPEKWLMNKKVWMRFYGAEFEWQNGFYSKREEDCVYTIEERLKQMRLFESVYEEEYRGIQTKQHPKKIKRPKKSTPKRKPNKQEQEQIDRVMMWYLLPN